MKLLYRGKTKGPLTHNQVLPKTNKVPDESLKPYLVLPLGLEPRTP